jgi:choline dehydrogenase
VTDTAYDVVVLGGGSAGCVLAARLSEDPSYRVALVEAGPDHGPLGDGRWPADLLDANFDAIATHDWGYAGGLSSVRAKVLGGCSAHNGCVTIRGAPRDYDEWAEHGGPGWAWSNLRAHVERGEATLRVRASRADDLEPARRALLDAAVELGYPLVDDPDRDTATPAVFLARVNAVGSVRWNASFAYLDPARGRPNLTIVPDTLVARIVIDRGRAVGAELIGPDGVLRIDAGLVVLAAGSYGSPAVLVRSGLGPESVLRRLAIPVVHDRPGVGVGLLDHPYVDLLHRPNARLRVAEAEFLGRPTNTGQALVRVAGSGCDAGAWDILIGGWADPERDPSGRPTGIRAAGLSATLQRPMSTGGVHVVSADPTVLPIVEHGFLSDGAGRDLATQLEAVEMARELAGTRAYGALTEDEIAPGRGLGPEELRTAVSAAVLGTYHPIRTCRMGRPDDPLAVVDGAGRTFGVDDLVVADASIIPAMPRANIHISVIALAEKIASDLVGNAASPTDVAQEAIA